MTTSAFPSAAHESAPRDRAWVRLASAVGLTLQPGRLVLAYLTFVALMAVGQTFDAIRGPVTLPVQGFSESAEVSAGVFEQTAALIGAAFHEALAALLSLDLLGALNAVGMRAAYWWVVIAVEHPISTLALFAPLSIIWCVGVGALCRMSVCDAALRVKLNAAEGLGFGLSRIVSLWSALIGPLVLVAILVGLIALGGLLLGAPVVRIFGGALYGVFLILGLLTVVLLFVYTLGWWLLAPAVAAESADGFEAVQRAYSYVLARPLRVALYLAGAILIGFITVGFTEWIIASALELTSKSAGAILELDPDVIRNRGDAAAGHAISGFFITLWEVALVGLAGAIALGYVASASSVVYLLIRRDCDGQELSDVWLPGAPAGARAVSPSSE